MSEMLVASCGCQVPAGWTPAKHHSDCPRRRANSHIRVKVISEGTVCDFENDLQAFLRELDDENPRVVYAVDYGIHRALVIYRDL